MKNLVPIALVAMTLAVPTLAQADPPASTGGGITVTSSKGTRTIPDTTQHTTLANGSTVSTSTGSDGKPNGSAGNTAGGATGASYEGE